MAEDWNAVPMQYRDAIVDADEIFNRGDEELGLGKLPKKKKDKQADKSWSKDEPAPKKADQSWNWDETAPVEKKIVNDDSWDFGGKPKKEKKSATIDNKKGVKKVGLQKGQPSIGKAPFEDSKEWDF